MSSGLLLARCCGVTRRSDTKALLVQSTTALLASIVLSCSGGARPIRPTIAGPIAPAQLAQLWVEPTGSRDLHWGIGGKANAPDAARFIRRLKQKIAEGAALQG